jgi:hypothetical protein
MKLRRWYIWVAGGAILGLIMAIILLVSGFFLRGSTYAVAIPSPVMTVVLPPTATSTSFIPTSTPTPTETPTPVPPPKIDEGIVIGGFVEVAGTEGDGLRLREDPSLDAKIAFLGLENEVFEVREGPVEEDGYEWWYLSNPYNAEKEGWAVANYLRQTDQQ